MSDPVADYMRCERELLAYRLTRDLAGRPELEDDPEEVRIESEFERIWTLMNPDDRRRLRQTREIRSAPWVGAMTTLGHEVVLIDSPSPLRAGHPARRLASR